MLEWLGEGWLDANKIVVGAALALVSRAHVLPFVLLMGAMAAWRRDWKEAAAWGALTLAFLAVMS